MDGYTPGIDYPIYNTVPFGLSFTCRGKLPGYYADPEARCQVSGEKWANRRTLITPIVSKIKDQLKARWDENIM